MRFLLLLGLAASVLPAQTGRVSPGSNAAFSSAMQRISTTPLIPPDTKAVPAATVPRPQLGLTAQVNVGAGPVAPPNQNTGTVAGRGERPLRLEDVLESVERNYPPLLAALQEREIAEGDLLVQQGRFDLSLRARTDLDRMGAYPNNRFDFGLDQPLQTWGASLFGGYRVGDGRFASYDGKLQTLDVGEFRSGIRLPLFRDREIDPRRADLRRAQVGLRLADFSIDQQRILIIQTATRRYWDWVAAGQRNQVALDLLNIATQREAILKDAVQLGQLAQIEVVDNQRAILQRRSVLVETERFLQNAAIELSLFYRDATGQPVLASKDRLPNRFPEPAQLTPDQVNEDQALALKKRPELLRFDAQRTQTQIEAELARNQRLPNVDIISGYARNVGTGFIPRGVNSLTTSLVFDLPFQRRQATGRLQSATARLTQIDQRERFTRDQITAEVRDASIAVEAAFQRALVLRDEVRVTRDLEDAERTRFDLGDSTLFILNLREQATADAAVREVNALADYQRAVALYEFAVARALQ